MVGKPPRDSELSRAVSGIDVVRYGASSIASIILILAAAAAAVMALLAVVLKHPPDFISREIVQNLPTLTGIIGTSGGIGAVLRWLDQEEKRRVTLNEALQQLYTSPTPENQELVRDLIRKLAKINAKN